MEGGLAEGRIELLVTLDRATTSCTGTYARPYFLIDVTTLDFHQEQRVQTLVGSTVHETSREFYTR